MLVSSSLSWPASPTSGIKTWRLERARADCAVEDDVPRAVGHDVADPLGQLAQRHEDGARDGAAGPLVLAAHVDEHGVLVALEQLACGRRVELEALLDLGHVVRIATALPWNACRRGCGYSPSSPSPRWRPRRSPWRPASWRAATTEVAAGRGRHASSSTWASAPTRRPGPCAEEI